jgi:multiple sugar transport system permease protein/sn-glycerol 3-phosphate transport system permease protein
LFYQGAEIPLAQDGTIAINFPKRKDLSASVRNIHLLLHPNTLPRELERIGPEDYVYIIPNYFTLASWNWLNTYRALVVPFSASGFGVFFLFQFFKTIPKELEEAASLEGCSRMRFLFQFMVPLSLPAITAFAIYSFVGAWNQYLWPLIVTQTTEMQTAQIGIGMFRSQNESMSWGVIMAATAMLMAPTVLLFIATQKQFVRGITMSGIKG